MKLKTDNQVRELIEAENVMLFEKKRAEFRDEARQNLLKIQQENRRTFNKKRKEARCYQVGDLVAIKRTQFGPGLKVHTPFIGPYEIKKVLRNNRYIVQKIGDHEGPNYTSTGADHIKPWPSWQEDELDADNDDPDIDGLRMVDHKIYHMKTNHSAMTMTILTTGRRIRVVSRTILIAGRMWESILVVSRTILICRMAECGKSILRRVNSYELNLRIFVTRC